MGSGSLSDSSDGVSDVVWDDGSESEEAVGDDALVLSGTMVSARERAVKRPFIRCWDFQARSNVDRGIIYATVVFSKHRFQSRSGSLYVSPLKMET